MNTSMDHNIKDLIRKNKESQKLPKITEKFMPILLLIITSVSILTTIGIIFTFLSETIEFFKRVSVVEFFTSTTLKPLSQDPEYGVLPLIAGTAISSVIAMLVAVPIGLMTAIYLSEYASERVRKIAKPLLEILAGIPTIVYGFFAFTFITPILREIIPNLEPTNILSPGLVMGVMIIPMVASLSEDI